MIHVIDTRGHDLIVNPDHVEVVLVSPTVENNKVYEVQIGFRSGRSQIIHVDEDEGYSQVLSLKEA